MNKKISILFLSLIVSLNLLSQTQKKDTTINNFNSPYQTIYNHLSNLQPGNYYPDKSAKSLYTNNLDENKSREIAIKLKQIFDGEGILLELEKIPNTRNYKDSITNKLRYVPVDKFPNIYLEKYDSIWLYSKNTVIEIKKLHNKIYPYGTSKLLTLFPPNAGTLKIFGLWGWQLFGIALLIILSFILYKLFSFLVKRILISIIINIGYKQLADKFINPVITPIGYLIIFPLLLILIPVLQLPIIVSQYIIIGLKSTWPIFAIVFFYRLMDVICYYLLKMAKKTKSNLDDQLIPLLRKILKIFVVTIGSLFILKNLNFDITGLIAGLSIGGLAFALAAQDTIKNFFGSLMIFLDKPFQVGDWITSENVDGTVEEVGFRSTKIRTFRNSVMTIPNGVITNRMIDNHGLRIYRRFMTDIAITYNTPATLIENFVEGLKQIVKNHPKTQKSNYEIHFNSLGSSSLNILFYIFFEVSNWTEELQARHEVLLEIMVLAEKSGVQFAYPTQTLHIESFPNKKANFNNYINSEDNLQNKIKELKKNSKR